MNLTKLRAELIRDEGRKSKVYLDTVGLATAGIGHLLVGAEKAAHPVGSFVGDAQIEAWFKLDVDEAVRMAKMFCASFTALSETRQRVLVNMAFNLGARLMQFVRLRSALAREDWPAAVVSMRESKWAGQVGDRAKRLQAAMVSNSVDI